jgi:hypothetical protein
MTVQKMRTRKLIRWGVRVPAWLAIAVCGCSNESASSAGSTSDASPADASMPKEGSNLPVVHLSEASAPTSSGKSATCGSKTCTAPAGGMVPNNACCLPDNSCGAFPDLSAIGMGLPGMGAPAPGDGGGGGCLDVTPGTPDPSCPSQMVMGFPLMGCCSRAGVCGLDLSIGGLGCNSLAALGGLGGLGGGPAMDAGEPQACGGKDAGVAAQDGAAPASDASPDAVADAVIE